MASLFDSAGDFYGDPRSAAILGTAAGLLQAAGPQRFPQSTAQAISGGLLAGFNMWDAAEQARRRSELLDAQTQHIGAQTEVVRESIAQTRRQRDALARIAGGGGLEFSPVEIATGVGAMQGDVGPTPGNAQRLDAVRSAQVNAPEPPPNAAQLLSMGLTEPQVSAIVKDWELRNPNLNYQGGMGLDPRTGRPRPGAMAVPQKVEGVMGAPGVDAYGRPTMTEVGGSAQLYGQTEDLKQQAQARYPSAADRARLPMDASRLFFETGIQHNPLQGLSVPGPVGQPPTVLNYAPAPGAPRAAGTPNTAPPAPRPAPAAPQPGAATAPDGRMVAPGPRPEGVTPKDWAERLAKQPATNARMNDYSVQLQRLEAAARQLRNSPGLTGITGVQGAIFDIWGSPAAGARSDLTSLESQVAVNVLQSMRNMSETGGALGNVSNLEIEKLQSNLSALKTAQSAGKMRQELLKIEQFAQESRQRVANAYMDTYNMPRTTPTQDRPPMDAGTARIMPRGNAGTLSWGALTQPQGAR